MACRHGKRATLVTAGNPDPGERETSTLTDARKRRSGTRAIVRQRAPVRIRLKNAGVTTVDGVIRLNDSGASSFPLLQIVPLQSNEERLCWWTRNYASVGTVITVLLAGNSAAVPLVARYDHPGVATGAPPARHSSSASMENEAR